MSTTMLAPALVEMFPDADNVTAVRSRDGELRSIDRYLEQNAANMDVEGKAALEDMRDALRVSCTRLCLRRGFEALRRTSALEVSWARQMRLSCNRSESSRRLLLVRKRVPFCLSRSQACDPKVYELSTKMPPLILLSYLQAALPSYFCCCPWLSHRSRAPACSVVPFWFSRSPQQRMCVSDGCCAGSPVSALVLLCV